MADVLTLPRPENWKVQGLCNSREQQFYAAEDITVSRTRLREAADACSWCPVLQQCREFTLTEQPEDGVWAGEVFTPSTKAAKLKRLADLLGVEYVPAHRGPSAPCGTVAAYRRHKRNKETPCWACREAQQESDRGRSHKQVAS